MLARAAGGRIGADIWQLLQNGKLFALRVELDAPALIDRAPGSDPFALASEIVLERRSGLASRRSTLNDLPAGTLVIRRGLVTLQHWNAALPRLELRDVDFDADARRALRSASAVRAAARRSSAAA